MGDYSNERYRCPDCDSSDGLAINDNNSGYCHACPEEEAFKPSRRLDLDNLGEPAVKEFDRPQLDIQRTLDCTDYRAFADRKITVDTARAFKATTTPEGFVVFRYGTDASKIRLPNKDFLAVGEFKEAPLYGQQLFAKGGRKLTICEGEYDAMAAYQIQGSKYPVVSIKSGASGAVKDCQKNFEWIDSFDEIVICFDADDPGVQAANKVAKLFGDKAAIMKHTKGHKDACDYLAAGDKTEFTNNFWRAEQYCPDDIVKSSSLRESLMESMQMPFCNLPWDGLNLMFYGLRWGEIWTILAGSGVGKSTFTKAILSWVRKHTNEKIGVLSLEETVQVAGLKMMSMDSGKLFHLPTVEQMKSILNDPSRVKEKRNLEDVTLEQRQKDKEEAFENVMSDDQFMFLRHEGHITLESVAKQLRYLAKAQGCRIILLDHISVLVGLTATGKGNEREAIDQTMHQLRSLVEETGILLINISHVRKKPDGAGHEEGGRVHSSDARGSGSIIQLSDVGIALEGNRQADNDEERNLTIVRGLKNRLSGETGVACALRYDDKTGMMHEVKQFNMEEAL